MRRLFNILVVLLLVNMLGACMSMSPSWVFDNVDDYRSSVLMPPLAAAGADQLVPPSSLVTLEGQSSYHPNGAAFKVRWSQILHGDQRPVVLSSAASINPTFVAPVEDDDLYFQLEVNDGTFCTYDTVHIRVEKNAVFNKGPLVMAGPDILTSLDEKPGRQNVVVGADEVVFRRVEVVDCQIYPTKDIDSYSEEYSIWALSGTTEGLESVPDFITFFNEEKFVNQNIFSEPLPFILGVQAPLTVEAGQTVVIEVTLDEELDYYHSLHWQQLRGSQVEVKEYGNLLIFKVPEESQQLLFTVAVSDGQREGTPEYVVMMVSPSTNNHVPLAVLNSSEQVHVGRPFILDGSRSIDYDGDLLTFHWQQLLGPNVELYSSENGDQLTVVAPDEAAVMAFKMQVCDYEICDASRTIVVNVLPLEENLPPITINEKVLNLGFSDLSKVSLTFLDEEFDSIVEASCAFSGQMDSFNCEDDIGEDRTDGESEGIDSSAGLFYLPIEDEELGEDDALDGNSEMNDGRTDQSDTPDIADDNKDELIIPIYKVTRILKSCITVDDYNLLPSYIDNAITCHLRDDLGAEVDISFDINLHK